MKPVRAIEPGLVQTFRNFTAVRLLFGLLGLASQLVAGARHDQEALALGSALVLTYTVMQVFSLVEISLLIGYLSLPVLQRRLKSAYLPIGVIWATLGPLVGHHIGFLLAPDLPRAEFIQMLFWESIPVLFIPLVVVAWQYSFRQVTLFCIFSALIDIAPYVFYKVETTTEARVFLVSMGAILIRTFTFLFVGNMITKLVRIQRDMNQRLTLANENLTQYASTLEQLTISRERNRLARELHDVLAHTLSGVAVELEGVRATFRSDPDQALGLVNHSLQAVREGLTETRRALQELRAKPLEDLGLSLAVRSLAESFAGRSGLGLSLEVDQELGETPVGVQQCVYRVAQEALSNVEKHAQASQVNVSLGRVDGRLVLVVADDGCGFDPNEPGDELKYGLRGMRERAAMIGASLAVESQMGRGTRVALHYGGGSA